MIDQPTIDRILDAAQIVDVVSEFVTLRKRGVNFVGLCPFHDDKTPSFYVSPAKGLCKCFACGKGGNVVHFVMEHEQMTYPEALRWLAKKYNIEIKERELTDEEKEVQNIRESLFVVNEFARDYFQNILYNHADGKAIGMTYFRQRGIRDDIVRKFQLGYSTTAHDALAQEALRKGYKKEFLIKTGLCYEKEDGSLRDRFWGRVIFRRTCIRQPHQRSQSKIRQFTRIGNIQQTKRAVWHLSGKSSHRESRLRLHGRRIYRRDSHAPMWIRECGG